MNPLFLYDSASSYILVSDVSCTSCPSQYYDASKSFTSESLSDDDYSAPNSYGSHRMISEGWSDRICPSKSSAETCVPNMPFYSVSNWVGDDSFPYDGILGLGPPTA